MSSMPRLYLAASSRRASRRCPRPTKASPPRRLQPIARATGLRSPSYFLSVVDASSPFPHGGAGGVHHGRRWALRWVERGASSDMRAMGRPVT